MVAQTAPLPNVRKLFIPDPGYIIADADLVGADAQVVAWEAGDEDLKAAFRAGLKIHAKNALDMFGPEKAGEDGLKMPLYKQNKEAVHGTNYIGSAIAIAEATGWSIGECRDFQRRWFQLHPKIKRWHERIQDELYTKKTVWNKFGYRIIYFDRVDKLLPDALAWIPQSTVALTCFKGALKMKKNCPWVTILLQNHDSLVFQYLKEDHSKRHLIKTQLENVVPYDDPLTIPWSLKVSEKSWGHCEKEEWGS